MASKPIDSTTAAWWRVLVLSAIVPLIIGAVLYRLHVPLGCPDRFVYLYSPVVAMRLRAVPLALLLALAFGFAVWLTASTASRRRAAGLILAGIAAVALAAWTYFAPPAYLSQQYFNSQSPSHDGAFVTEAVKVVDVRDYLRSFPQRARTPPQEMRGTRVISNPPGTTLLAIGVDRVLQRWPALTDWVTRPIRDQLPPDVPFEQLRRSAALGLVFLGVLTGLWLLAAPLLYHAARLFLPASAALVYSLCCVFTPATLLLTPGKDPAQLLTVAAPLCFWLHAYRHGRVWAAGLAGLLFVPACLTSLVHVWVAAVVAVATWGAARQLLGLLLRLVVPAMVGALLGAALLYLCGGLDPIAAAQAIAQSQAEVTRGPDAMPLVWQLLGVPLFLLFAGPAWWTISLLAGWPAARVEDRHDADARFGFYLLLGSAVVMLATVGFTNLETPRLWIPFVPLLLLGGFLRLAAVRQSARRVAVVFAVLLFVQVACSALHWSLMDMREAETRLVEEWFFD